MEPEFNPISKDDAFCFDCSPAVPCFNECCRELVQNLTPYDILRLKTHLGLTSQEFLKRYTVSYPGPETGLPVISLKSPPELAGVCPFVRKEGCAVYPDRPSSCRTYPVARAIRKDRVSGAVTEHFALLREAHCRGFEQAERRTVREWLGGQGTSAYFEMNDRLMDIISLKNRLMPGPLPPGAADDFFLGLYDLDRFRAVIEQEGLPEDLEAAPDLLEAAKTDGIARLNVGMAWVRYRLFGHQGI